MAGVPMAPIAPGVFLNGTVVTPGTITYSPPLSRLWVGGAGALVATMAQNGAVVTLAAVPSGGWINDIAIINVGTATTCTDIVGFW